MLEPLGMIDGWNIALVANGQELPANFAVLGSMLVAAGLDVGVVTHVGDGVPTIIGPELEVRFRERIPQSWQARVLESLGGFNLRPSNDGTWTLEATTRFGGDTWRAMRELTKRRDVMNVRLPQTLDDSATDATQEESAP